MGDVFVIGISVALLAWLWWKADRPLAVLFTAAYLLRLLVLYADTYHFLGIPFSGSDTEDFHAATLAFLSSDGPIKTNYTYILAVFYYVFGDWGRFTAIIMTVCKLFQ